MRKKILAILSVLVGALVLAGCGTKSPETTGDKNTPATENESSLNNNGTNISTQDLPTPTGKVDSTVDAIIDGGNKEGAQALSDDNDAKSATASDSQAVDETGQDL
ncbi:MAG TPA: hypothetical protein VK255_04655 [Patescibacteria group bacterium]|nr:hypothetical protein [Patescibacteria group bacterium]